MKGLDLSKFRKVRVEKDHTVMRHPEGHEIRIAHKALSPEMHEKLSALPHMAQGGEDQALKPNQRTEGFNKARSRGVGIVHEQLHGKENYAEGGEAILKENYEHGGPSEKGNVKLQQAHKHPKKLADGGLAETATSFVKKASGQEAPAATTTEPTQEEKYEAIREQNKKNMGYADGGPIDQDKANDFMKGFKKVPAMAKGGQAGYHFHFYAAGGESGSPNSAPAESFPSAQEVAARPDAPAEASPSSQASPIPQSQQPQALDAPISPPDVTNPPAGSLQEQNVANIEREAAGQQQLGQITGKEQEKEAGIQGTAAKQLSDINTYYQNAGQSLSNQFNDVADQVATGSIDPNHWFTSQTVPGQLLTSIGMMLAGAAMGYSGNPEMAQNAINNVINRDIDAQKSNLQNKQTLLSKYMEMYRSLPEAEAATRLTLLASTEGLIKQQAAKANSQAANIQAGMAVDRLRREALKDAEPLAKSQVMSQLYGGMAKTGAQPSSEEQAYQQQMQNMRILNPDLGKDMQDKYLPNVGVARVPIPDKLREELTSRKDLSDKLSQLENFSRENSGTVLDRAKVNQGTALARNVQDAYRRANAQGVFREAEKDFVEKSIKTDPTVFFSKYRAIPGYQTTRKLNDDTIKQFYKSYGIKPFQSQAEGAPSEGQTSVSASGKPIVYKGGKWLYQ